jgi:hypothetical protein
MNDMSNAHASEPASFHFDHEDERLVTRYLGTLTLRDIGLDRVEAILVEENRSNEEAADADHEQMLQRVTRRLIIESVEGEHGERFTAEQFDAGLPGRLMFDMTQLKKALLRMYGLDSEDVKNA